VPVRPSPPPPIVGAPGATAKKPSEAPAPPRIDRDSPTIELRLAIGRDGLGLELNKPARLEALEITELFVGLPGVRFPLDVSGGVSRFRHRRGELKRLALEIDARALGRWAAPKLRGVVSTHTPEVWLAVRRDAATMGLASKDGSSVLAFDVTLDTREDDACLTVVDARGLGLPAPPTTLAISVLRALLKDTADREGARFVIRRAATRLARALLPEAGARAPSCDGVRWSMTAAATDAWILHASLGVQADLGEAAARAREAALLARDGDDARVAGDLERARALDLAALERAPRHAALAARVAEIDALAGGRAEAALAMLREADPGGGAARGALGAELLAEAGDVGGAVAAFARVGDLENVPALAARAYFRAAALTEDPHDALVWLDLAVARAPAMAAVRWARVERRLRAGRAHDAVADVEHLEAASPGAKAKHEMWRRAGDAWRAAGLGAEAATLYERALRYVPDEPEALAGLGAALVEEASTPMAAVERGALRPAAPYGTSRREKRAARGVSLIARAIELAEARGADVSGMEIDLGRALEGALGDRPAAIARVRAVPNTAKRALEARALEARWRGALGDVAGASLAWARVRDLATAQFEEGDRASSESAAAFLVEAAQLERDRRGDLPAAQRHLAAALRLRPRDPEIDRAYRDVCARIAPPPPPAVAAVPPPPPAAKAPAPPPPSPPAAELDEAQASARVEDLTRTLQGDPTRDDVVDELSALLIRLGRSFELFALLTARLEDAPPERRAALLPAQRAVLLRLEEEATAAGRTSEASLFRDARLALET
jgi:tetratricopeptide (TPR) repeat protein